MRKKTIVSRQFDGTFAIATQSVISLLLVTAIVGAFNKLATAIVIAVAVVYLLSFQRVPLSPRNFGKFGEKTKLLYELDHAGVGTSSGRLSVLKRKIAKAIGCAEAIPSFLPKIIIQPLVAFFCPFTVIRYASGRNAYIPEFFFRGLTCVVSALLLYFALDQNFYILSHIWPWLLHLVLPLSLFLFSLFPARTEESIEASFWPAWLTTSVGAVLFLIALVLTNIDIEGKLIGSQVSLSSALQSRWSDYLNLPSHFDTLWALLRYASELLGFGSSSSASNAMTPKQLTIAHFYFLVTLYATSVLSLVYNKAFGKRSDKANLTVASALATAGQFDDARAMLKKLSRSNKVRGFHAAGIAFKQSDADLFWKEIRRFCNAYYVEHFDAKPASYIALASYRAFELYGVEEDAVSEKFWSPIPNEIGDEAALVWFYLRMSIVGRENMDNYEAKFVEQPSALIDRFGQGDIRRLPLRPVEGLIFCGNADAAVEFYNMSDQKGWRLLDRAAQCGLLAALLTSGRFPNDCEAHKIQELIKSEWLDIVMNSTHPDDPGESRICYEVLEFVPLLVAEIVKSPRAEEKLVALMKNGDHYQYFYSGTEVD